MFKYLFIFFLLLISCKNTEEKSCDPILIKNLVSNIESMNKEKYYVNFPNKGDILDFVKLYTSHCNIPFKNGDYHIEKAINLFGKEKEGNMFYGEIVCFENYDKCDSIIRQIKFKNCIDPYNIKINKVYKIKPSLVLLVNFSNFDVRNFEKKILLKYKNCQIININEP